MSTTENKSIVLKASSFVISDGARKFLKFPRITMTITKNPDCFQVDMAYSWQYEPQCDTFFFKEFYLHEAGEGYNYSQHGKIILEITKSWVKKEKVYKRGNPIKSARHFVIDSDLSLQQINNYLTRK